MTPEEAVRVLRKGLVVEEHTVWASPAGRQPYLEAIELAIAALRAQPMPSQLPKRLAPEPWWNSVGDNKVTFYGTDGDPVMIATAPSNAGGLTPERLKVMDRICRWSRTHAPLVRALRRLQDIGPILEVPSYVALLSEASEPRR